MAKKKLEFPKLIYIFGAHSRAQSFGKYIEALYPETEIAGYLYDSDEDNPEKIGDVSVISMGEARGLDISLPVYIATRGENMEGISSRLRERGFEKAFFVDPQLDTGLRNAFIKKIFAETGREFRKLDDIKTGRNSDTIEDIKDRKVSARIFIAKSVFDKPLQNPVELMPYESYIQAGAALAGKRLTECSAFDDEGENISPRNRQFCELTALFWIWKNTREDIIGLSHYRRHFILPPDWIEAFEKYEVDAVLPVPLFVSPCIKDNYMARHTAASWNTMLEVISSYAPDMYAAAVDFFDNSGCYSPCNMMIMRREVLSEFCEWLFPILFTTAEKTGELEDGYQNRYPGFLAERLLTFWCFFHEHKFKIVYADKNFLK